MFKDGLSVRPLSIITLFPPLALHPVSNGIPVAHKRTFHPCAVYSGVENILTYAYRDKFIMIDTAEQNFPVRFAVIVRIVQMHEIW